MICIVRARNSRNNIGSRPHPGLSPTPNRNEPAFAPPKAGRERTEILLARTNRRRERRRRKDGRTKNQAVRRWPEQRGSESEPRRGGRGRAGASNAPPPPWSSSSSSSAGKTAPVTSDLFLSPFGARLTHDDTRRDGSREEDYFLSFSPLYFR